MLATLATPTENGVLVKLIWDSLNRWAKLSSLLQTNEDVRYYRAEAKG